MTWSELIHGTRSNNNIHELSDWIKEATEFGREHNVIINLKTYENRCCQILLIEITHPDDPKNTVKFKKEHGTYISASARISSYFEHLYDKLPIVRRNRNKQSKDSLRNLM